MGQFLNTCGCDAQDEDNKSDIDYESYLDEPLSPGKTMKTDFESIIKIQSQWRGYRVRSKLSLNSKESSDNG